MNILRRGDRGAEQPRIRIKMIFTGTFDSISRNGSLSRNARMNRPSMSAGRIFGRDAATDEQPAGGDRAQREIAGFGAVGAPRKCPARRCSHCSVARARRLKSAPAHSDRGRRCHAARRCPVRDAMQIDDAGTRQDVLDFRAAKSLDERAQDDDVPFVPRRPVRMAGLGRSGEESGRRSVHRRLAKPGARSNETRYCPPALASPACRTCTSESASAVSEYAMA